MRILGVDPGSAHTGWCVTDGGRLVDSGTIHASEYPEWLDYIGACCALVAAESHELLAVEDVVAPNSHLGLTAPLSVIRTAQVLGAVLHAGMAAGSRLVLVRPGGNGSGPYGSYPSELVSASEMRGRNWQIKPAGKGALNHQRSAFDVCRQATRITPKNHMKSVPELLEQQARADRINGRKGR